MSTYCSVDLKIVIKEKKTGIRIMFMFFTFSFFSSFLIEKNITEFRIYMSEGSKESSEKLTKHILHHKFVSLSLNEISSQLHKLKVMY